MGLEVGGLIGILVLVADVWAILNIVGSSASLLGKAIWVVVILALPVLGLFVWLLAGPRATRLAR
jgi:Phospholipase_D-nuclease N-terminal